MLMKKQTERRDLHDPELVHSSAKTADPEQGPTSTMATDKTQAPLVNVFVFVIYILFFINHVLLMYQFIIT